ncbi:hypothetical protein COEREDRAFT_83208 [Coemansia reversa NRRL 1564]|uniref:Aminoglycoside phosphotransferase domain-containing protein n=1 Tax=Coemansia reversa (strain ATCC 12441 / NRRL 1564) TaxID=763665 RepID=A0A2G5B4C4_COERN|nr:hypothetical protein COEREDRAFT_83208 [Coemansia reversa NRRL 1564]|eukprot:PIA13841.1 hypothetical protein COEREDRAFT_83208 [Coemansia reversa NRRL 1564]
MCSRIQTQFMTSSLSQHPSPGLRNKASAPAFTTADYFDAFSSIDRNIRDLIDGCPQVPDTADWLPCATETAIHGLESPVSTAPSQLLPPLSAVDSSKEYAALPPSLNISCHDVDDDEEAIVAFLCSCLPHYEGTAPIYYDDLDNSLNAYLESTWGDDDDVLGGEEHVPDSAWDTSELLQTPDKHDFPPSPQTLPGFSINDARIFTYERRIDFDELLLVIRDAVAPDKDVTDFRVGQLKETDFMLLYEVALVSESVLGWVVQIPKHDVPQGVLESEVLSVAYVGENTSIPVSDVLAYNFSADNPIGVPYVILQRMAGEPLSDHWTHLGARQKRKVLDHIAEIVVQLSRLTFPAIGSLIIANGSLAIGPLLHARQCENGYVQLDTIITGSNQSATHRYGPFTSTCTYYHAMIRASLDALQLLEEFTATEPSLSQIELETYASLVDQFVVNDDCFVLMPESLDFHHFLIDPQTCNITAVVDWTFCGTRPLTSLVQPPPFTFDDTPRWEPTRLDARLAYRRNLVRYRQWFKAGLQKKAWASLGTSKSREMADLVRFGYWRFKFESDICENVQYTNPWTFRAIWEHFHDKQEFAVWVATAQARNLRLV